MPRFFGHKQGVDALVRAVNACRRPRHRVPDRLRLLVRELEAPDRRGLGPDGPGAGGGVQVPDQAGRRRRAHPHRRRPLAGLGQAARRPGSTPSAAPRTTRASPCRWPSTTAAAGTWCRPAAMPCSTACTPEALDEATLSRYMALSFAPDPDLFIRTGGEMRISNFLLWQIGLFGVRLHRVPVARLRRDRHRRGHRRPTGSATGASGAFATRRTGAPGHLTPMLRQRVVTAVVLLALLVPALFAPRRLALRPADAAADRRCRLGMGAPEPVAAWSPSLAMGAGCWRWPARPRWPPAGRSSRRRRPGGWQRGVGAGRRAGAAQRPVAVAATAAAGALGAGPRGTVGRLAGDGHARSIGINFILSVFCLVWVADIAAYFGGRALRPAQAGAEHQPRQELGGRVERHGRRVRADAGLARDGIAFQHRQR